MRKINIDNVSKMFSYPVDNFQKNRVQCQNHKNKEWVKIVTPHLDRHNDCLQLYTRKEGNGYFITDDGCVITDLINSGCPLDTPKRQ